MNNADFDKFHDRYNDLIKAHLSFFDNDAYFAEYKIRLVKHYTKSKPAKILEYGCGIGRNLTFLRIYFPDAEIYGCDISTKSLETAKKDHPAARLFQSGKGPVAGKFDLIVVANVLHHIVPASRPTSLHEIFNFLNEEGALFIFEHNPYNPVTRHLVNTCPLDNDAVLIKPRELTKLLSAAGFLAGNVNYTLFFPAFFKGLRFLEAFLVHIPLGGQYFVRAQKRQGT